MRELIKKLAAHEEVTLEILLETIVDMVNEQKDFVRKKKLKALKSASIIDPEVGGLMTPKQVKSYEDFCKEIDAAESDKSILRVLKKHKLKEE